MNFGFIRAAAASPRLRPADVAYNVDQTIKAMEEAAKSDAALILFPELGLSGYTCADLFLQDRLLSACRHALSLIAEATSRIGIATVVGLPLERGTSLWNCAAVLSGGQIRGIVPKSYLPNYKQYYETRWFAPAAGLGEGAVEIEGQSIPFGPGLLFEARPEGGQSFPFAVEVCEDLWVPIPPSSVQALRGALLLLNPSASDEMVGKADYRRDLVLQQSARCVAGYLYASAGTGESSTDLLFSGHCLAAEYGGLLAESKRFSSDTEIIYADFDIERLRNERQKLSSFSAQATQRSRSRRHPEPAPIRVDLSAWKSDSFTRSVDPHPFVPKETATRDARCREIFSIQASALAKRLEHSRAKMAVVGISGGLDSTLALLVAAKAMDLLKRKRSDILAVTMPGFGTTSATLENARELMASVGAETREVDIRAACLQHFKDIGHDPSVHSVVYENVQARERTQILMDLANARGGIVIGTGDLSEAALGWSTYNGDHMSMYAVNCSVPKTLVRSLVLWVAETEADEDTASVLRRIVATPISPELLPPAADGSIAQKTEDLVGPYELHDFFLYQLVRWGTDPEKIRFLALKAFGAEREAEIEKWLDIFLSRFFAQQFKRSCVPDGPKVGSISLSPRGDWRMPSDAVSDLWLKKPEGERSPL